MDEEKNELDEASDPETSEPKKEPVASESEPSKAMTAGQRLAAAKAAKAARKAAKRGKDAELVESKVIKQASAANEWLKENGRGLWIGVVVVGLGIAGWLGWSGYQESQAAAATALLQEAVSTATAEIRPGGDVEVEDEEDAEETYASVAERAERAIPRFRKVTEAHGDTAAAPWARLGEGAALLEVDRAEEALEAFRAARQIGGGDPTIAWRALEGIIFSHEADENWEEADQAAEELSNLERGRYAPFAKFHRARLLAAQGEKERAAEMLQQLITSLDEQEDEEAPPLGYLRDQAEVLLTELDPSLVPARPGIPPGMGGGGPTEDIQRRIQELLQQQGAGGNGPIQLPLPGGE